MRKRTPDEPDRRDEYVVSSKYTKIIIYDNIFLSSYCRSFVLCSRPSDPSLILLPGKVGCVRDLGFGILRQGFSVTRTEFRPARRRVLLGVRAGEFDFQNEVIVPVPL